MVLPPAGADHKLWEGQEWASPVHSKRPHQGMLLMATFHFFIMPQLIRYTTMSSDMTASCMGPQPRGRETSLLHTHDHSPKMACTWVRSRQDAYPGETSQAGCGKNNRGNLSTEFQRTPLSKTSRKYFFQLLHFSQSQFSINDRWSNKHIPN